MKPLSLLLLTLALSPVVHAADKLVLQLKWIRQAQFAGYYVAQENGYYADEGLEVDIRAAAPNASTPADVAAAGDADVVVEWMPAALVAREEGIPLVNIAQPFKKSAASLTCLSSAEVNSPDDLRGKRIGHWPGDNKLQVVSLLNGQGIPIADAGGAPAADAAVLHTYDNPIVGLSAGEVDCISTVSYADPVLLFREDFHEDELVVFDYQSLGAATLQDGLYVLEGRLNDAAFADVLSRFVRASMRGWCWAGRHQKEAVQMVMETKGVQNEVMQRYMMSEIASLTAGTNGALHVGDYERTVQILLAGGTLSQKPQGAWTSAITDGAEICTRSCECY